MRTALILFLCAGAAIAAMKTDIEFAKAGDLSLTLDASIPDGPGPFPTVIVVHGGGWRNGDKQMFVKPLFEPLTKAGFTWRQSDYRKWLGEAGFASVEIVPTPTPSTLVFAR